MLDATGERLERRAGLTTQLEHKRLVHGPTVPAPSGFARRIAGPLHSSEAQSELLDESLGVRHLARHGVVSGLHHGREGRDKSCEKSEISLRVFGHRSTHNAMMSGTVI